jgi:hypothetical protein
MLGFHSIERGTFSSGFRSKQVPNKPDPKKSAATTKKNTKNAAKPQPQSQHGQAFMFMNRLFAQPQQPGVRTLLPPPPGQVNPRQRQKPAPSVQPITSYPNNTTITLPEMAGNVWKSPPAYPVQQQQPSDVVRLQKDQNSMLDILNNMWEFIQSAPGQGPHESDTVRLTRIERDVSDLRQQQNLLVQDKQEDGAELSNIIAELSSLKQRLSKTMSQAADQLGRMEKASVPAQIQKVVDQLQVDSNWLYATVMIEKLPYYASASLITQPVGVYGSRQRILILYKTVENKEGIWMQVRNANEPDKRYWVKLTDDSGNVTIGHFGIAA